MEGRRGEREEVGEGKKDNVKDTKDREKKKRKKKGMMRKGRKKK